MAHHHSPAVIRQRSTISPSLVLAGSLLTTSLLPGAAAWGQCQANELAKLTASDGGDSDYFGRSVAVSGKVAIVGANGHDTNGISYGSAYVFRFDGTTWIQESELLASDGASGDQFGWSVAISGATVIVGARAHDDACTGNPNCHSGAAYVYRYDGATWFEEAKLLASDGAAGDLFGHSVAISDGLVLIGARDDGGLSGSAYVYRNDGSTWVEEAKLVASDAAVQDWFGYSVAISGDVVVIGAHKNDDNGSNSGSAYIYRYDGSRWVEEAKLLPLDGHTADFFGWSVAIGGDVALIGTRGDDDNGFDAGSAYVYRYNGSTWIEETELLASDGAPFDYFGYSIAITGDVALVGKPVDNATSLESVYAFGYDGSTWNQIAQLLPSDGVLNDGFARSVAISDDLAIVGAAWDDDNGFSSGSAYLFDAGAPGTCPWDLDGNGSVGILDLLALLAAWGTDPGRPPDFDGDGDVGITDLLELLANWGPCR